MCLNCEIDRRASQNWFVINDVEQEFSKADNVFGMSVQEFCFYSRTDKLGVVKRSDISALKIVIDKPCAVVGVGCTLNWLPADLLNGSVSASSIDSK